MNSSEYTELYQTCRICLCRNDNMVCMLANNDRVKDLNDLLSLIFESEIVFDKILPSYICELCVTKLETVRDLKITLMRTNKILNECLKTAKVEPDDSVFETTHVYPFEKTVKIITPIELYKLPKVNLEVAVKETDQKSKEIANRKLVVVDNNEEKQQKEIQTSFINKNDREMINGRKAVVITRKMSLSKVKNKSLLLKTVVDDKNKSKCAIISKKKSVPVNTNKNLISKTASEKIWEENSLRMINNDSFDVQEAVNSNRDKQQKKIKTSFNNKNVKEMIIGGKTLEIIREFSPPKIKNKSLLSKTVVKDNNIEKDDVISKKLLSVNKNILSKTIPEKNIGENNKENPLIMIDNKPFLLKEISLIPNEIIKNSLPETILDSITENMSNLIKIDKEKFINDELNNFSINLTDNRLPEMIFDPTVKVKTEKIDSLLISEKETSDKITKDVTSTETNDISANIKNNCFLETVFKPKIEEQNQKTDYISQNNEIIETNDVISKETNNILMNKSDNYIPENIFLDSELFMAKKLEETNISETNNDERNDNRIERINMAICLFPREKVINKTKKLYKKELCKICNILFDSQKDLDKHNKIEHPDKETVKCPLCCLTFVDPKTFQWHFSIVHQKYKCTTCLIKFTNKKVLEKHKCPEKRASTQESEIPIKPKFSCTFCGKIFVNCKKFIAHTRLHMEKEPYNCQFCGQKFLTMANLWNHAKIHRGENRSINCDICGKSFKSLLKHHRHKSEVHILKSFTCQVCLKKFHNKLNLERHMENIHTKMVCLVCKAECVGRNKLQRHFQTHSPPVSFSCTKCSRTFKKLKCLQTHLEKHGIIHDFKPYNCPICDYKTTKGHYLNLHINHHHPEMGIQLGKHYRCLLCRKIFTSKIILDIHNQRKHRKI